MISRKQIISFCILASSLVLSFFVIFDSPADSAEPALVSVTQGAGEVSPSLDFKLTSPSGGPTPREALPPSINPSYEANLTEALALQYFQEIVNFNKGELTDLGGKPALAMPSDQSDLELMKQIQNFSSLAILQFNNKDLRVSPDDSLEAQVAYLASFRETTARNFLSFSTPIEDILDQWLTSKNDRPLREYLSRSENQTRDLLALTVPAVWKDFHLQNLNLWQKKTNVYNALLGLEIDPLKAYLAIQEITSIAQENAELQTLLTNRVQQLIS